MTADSDISTGPENKRPIILPPWLVGLAAVALYGWTLNHWVTFSSLAFTAPVAGWDWHPGPLPWRPSPQFPLFLILTSPLRLLPAVWRVVGLNLFAAACAALTLAFLARSVRLLSQDRTEDQRRRERAEHGLLSLRAAFLPAALAVLLLATQLTFWDNAVAASGPMLDALVFAFLILSLLEFRISRNEKWLNVFALAYGLGMTDDWALIGFFPCFLLALAWIKRAEFFKWKFVLRMTGWGCLGLLLYLPVPLAGALANDGGFWDLLHQKWAEQYIYLTRIQRFYAVIASVPTLIPLFFAAIRWPSSRDDMHIEAHGPTRFMVRSLHLMFLVMGFLMFFDAGSIPALDLKSIPTPRNLGMGVQAGWPGFLSFYYLAALSVGYYSGYVLLVFGKDQISRWFRTRGIARLINQVVTGLLWVAAVALPAMLFLENYRHIRDLNSPAVADFGREMAKALPAKPGVVLADDPARLYLAMGAAQKIGLPNQNQYAFVESRCLVHGEYLRWLVDRFPSIRGEFVNPGHLPDGITDLQAGELLAHLTQEEPVYYLHPSFGGFFERVCMTPYRLGGNVHPYPTNLLESLGLSAGAIATNQAYWRALESNKLAALPQMAEKSADARRIAAYYSQMLDYWGAELQKMATRRKLTNLLEDANADFAEAIRLNPNNLVARANQQFNAHLRGAPPAGPPVSASTVAADFFNRWDSALALFGPADTPELDIQIGRYFAQRRAFLLAAPLFQRSLELTPGDPVGELDLINTYVDMGLADAAFALIKDMREHSAGNPLELAGVEALAFVSKKDFAQADALLADTHKKYPQDVNFAGVMAALYRLMGDRALGAGKGSPDLEKSAEKDASVWFKKALAALDDQLQLLKARSASAQDILMLNRRRADLQMAVKDYDAAIATLTPMVLQDSENPIPLLGRAISELEIGRLDAARTDYQALERMMPSPPPAVYYGLAQVAQKQNDKPAQIRYDKLYLQHAPRNTLEYSNLSQQLRKLESR